MTQTFDLIVRGGEVVNHAGRGFADIGVRGGKIAAIGDLSQASAGEIFDATGLTVLPGVIDTQVHFREPGLEWKEDLESGSRAAALGGVVAVFEMPNTEPTTTDPDALADKLARAKRPDVDRPRLLHRRHPRERDHLGELERLPGCCGIKVFMGASTGTLLVADDDGRARGAAPCESPRRPSTPRTNTAWSSAARWPARRLDQPPRGARRRERHQSTHRLVRPWRARTGARIHVLHVTTAEEIDFLADNKDVATVEVTPQHLTLDGDEAYERLKGWPR
jgi:dihydroorotase